MNQLPKQINDYTNKSLLNGYLRFLDDKTRKEYTKILETYYQWEGGIPFAITAFADVLVWNDNYVYKYNLIEDNVSVILSGFEYFFQNIEDDEYVEITPDSIRLRKKILDFKDRFRNNR